MRLTKILLQQHHQQTWQTALSTFKASQLKHLAQATGVRVAGPKADLIERLEREIEVSSAVHGEDGDGSASAGKKSRDRARKAQTEEGKGKEKGGDGGSGGRRISLLSIDMGIRNLAFAHLTMASPFFNTGTSTSISAPARICARTKSKPIVCLNAWHRLDLTSDEGISAIPSISSSRDNSSSSSSETNRSKLPSNIPLDPESHHPLPDKQVKEDETAAFSLPEYADRAYEVIIRLLDTYRPTHLLIERQRFRSFGGVAVQEWSIRVGVFEGMLYAVLQTLRRQQERRLRQQHTAHTAEDVNGKGGGNEEEAPVPEVTGLEPARVARYWAQKHGIQALHMEGRKKTRDSVDAKKLKIDLVGSWLDDANTSPASTVPSPFAFGDAGGIGPNGDERAVKRAVAAGGSSTKVDLPLSTSIDVAGDEEARRTVEGYLYRWYGRRGGRKSADAGVVKKLGKLDDLADCLLQGLTWVEWQVVRERVRREGVSWVFE